MAKLKSMTDYFESTEENCNPNAHLIQFAFSFMLSLAVGASESSKGAVDPRSASLSPSRTLSLALPSADTLQHSPTHFENPSKAHTSKAAADDGDPSGPPSAWPAPFGEVTRQVSRLAAVPGGRTGERGGLLPLPAAPASSVIPPRL